MTREAGAINREGATIEARRKAAPVAATLLDTLVAAQAALKGDQESIARFIISVGAHVDAGHEASEADAERVLHECGLWPAAAATGAISEVADKMVANGITFYLVEVAATGETHWISGPRACHGTPKSTHAVIINGVEVARIPAKNDWHAINKARKLFGPDARAVKMLDEAPTCADPFSRIRS